MYTWKMGSLSSISLSATSSVASAARWRLRSSA